MIPKIIHYTWFSNDEMPEKIKQCLASWKQTLRGYEFRKWDMDAIKDIDSIFLKEALQAHKWAYAADFVRLFAIYHCGGIYLDTDVILLKPLDEFLSEPCFIGKESSIHYENEGVMQGLSSHCFGAEKNNPFIADCLAYYKDRHFITSDEKDLPQPLRMNIVLLPYIQGLIAHQRGYDWRPSVQRVQKIKDYATIYPSRIFDPFQGKSVNHAHSCCIHLAAGGWRDKEGSKKMRIGLLEKFFMIIVRKMLAPLHYEVRKFN